MADAYDAEVDDLLPPDVSTFLGRANKIAYLATLDPVDYDKCRQAEAAALGVRVATLDSKVSEVRPRRTSTDRAFSNDTRAPLPPRFSDDAIALTFTARHADLLLYVPAWNAWLRWDGSRWTKDDVLAVYDLARGICREIASDAAMEKDGEALAKSITSASTVSAVERLARSDARHARATEAFDADPWLLNTPGGVVDLRNGKLRPHTGKDLMTKVAGATPGGNCPRFLEFMGQITQGNQHLVSFLQRYIGYTLTGSIQEHAFIFTFGPGGNGKGVLFSTVSAMMGDYGTTAMQDVFTAARGHEGHASRLAALRGARMVSVSETEEGRQWAEARIKAWTGGDAVSANFMHGNPFEFRPVCKLWFSGNHKPPLRNPDAAMRRRMNLVPLTYVPAAPDPGLADALKAELPGILSWAVHGCLEWQKVGLLPPAIVTAATDEYFEDQNGIALWVTECCDAMPSAQVASRKLFSAWKAWAVARGDDPGTEMRFSTELQKSFAKKRGNAGVFFLGITLRAESREGAAE